MTPRTCTNHPHAKMLEGYIPYWPWRCDVCSVCGEAYTDWGLIRTLLWEFLIGWYWNGMIRVRDDQ